MICPNCGKKSVFDWNRCPGCGADPWTSPHANRGGTADADPSPSGGSRVLRSCLRSWTDRPKLSFVLVTLGLLLILQALVACFRSSPLDSLPGQLGFQSPPLGRLLGCLYATLPGLLLIAVGEGLAYLAAIRSELARGQRQGP